MKHFLSGLIFMILPVSLFTTNSSIAAGFKDASIMHIEYPGWFVQDPFYDLQSAVNKSKRSGKHGVMILFTTQGCSYCSVFIKASLGNPEIAAAVKKNFVSIGMEIFDDVDMTDTAGQSMPIKQYAYQQRAGFSPTLLFYDNSGKMVLRVVGYQSPQRFTAIMQYVTEKQYEQLTLAQFFASKTSSGITGGKLRQDSLFIKPPYQLNNSGIKPLMILFEEPGCKECNYFHDTTLADKKVRSSLEKFDVVRLNSKDARNMLTRPDGVRITPADWYKQTGFSMLPALIFYNEKRKKVLETDSLVKQNRMMNSINYVLERAYEKNWTYQMFARSKAMERLKKRKAGKEQ